jgi:hypothetical protein
MVRVRGNGVRDAKYVEDDNIKTGIIYWNNCSFTSGLITSLGAKALEMMGSNIIGGIDVCSILLCFSVYIKVLQCSELSEIGLDTRTY